MDDLASIELEPGESSSVMMQSGLGRLNVESGGGNNPLRISGKKNLTQLFLLTDSFIES